MTWSYWGKYYMELNERVDLRSGLRSQEFNCRVMQWCSNFQEPHVLLTFWILEISLGSMLSTLQPVDHFAPLQILSPYWKEVDASEILNKSCMLSVLILEVPRWSRKCGCLGLHLLLQKGALSPYSPSPGHRREDCPEKGGRLYPQSPGKLSGYSGVNLQGL